MIIQRNKYEIKEKIEFNNILTNNNILEIKLKDIQNINNMKDLFSSRYNLNSLLDISKWNKTNDNNMSNMFSFCTKLNSLPDISK